MSRSSHQRQQQQLLAQQQQQMADNDAAAAAAEMFDMFCLATTMRQILGLHRNMCDTVGLRPAPLNEFYPKLKAKIRSWKAQALWKKFDARAAHRAYSKGNACTGTRVLVIGAGPCGLRTAIEAQLLGAKVVVLEKRDRISRNNVLHLWPFVITDLRNLGAKKFYGKFCAGSIDHISIRQLQCILLKVALLLGVEIHEGVSFERTIEPSEGCGWRAAISPEDHAVSHYEFDVLIGADGKRNTLEAFKRKEFRGKLAIAITANFINKKTEAEAKAEEISGVAFIFNQTFFKELYHTTGIDLENIVYYKDETHYFVMTAKKHSLIDKGVILQDFADPAELLAPANVNTEKLLDYAREAAEFSTKYQMPNLEFAVNHYGKPDVAMFDFTSMFAAESSSRVIVRKNYRLLQCLVGDSLLEPFWPTGSGCARGFLSSMDAAYAIKLWNNPRNSTLGVLAQRESIYRLLAQTTPENLQRDIGSYTVDPATRYPNLNRTSVNVWQVKHLIDCDDKSILEQTFMDTNSLQASQAETPVRRKRRTGDTLPLSAVLLRWIKAQLHSYEFTQNLNEVSDCFTNGKVLCALINRYRPDLVDFNSVKDLPAADSNDLAFKILDKELKISRVMTGKDSIELDKIDSKIWLNYLEQICEVFRGEIPHVKHPKLDVSELREKNRNNAPDFSRLLQMTSRKAKSPMQDVADVPHVIQRRSVLDEEKVKRQRKHEPGQTQVETPRRGKKRRSAEKTTNIEERQQRLKEIEENRQDRQSKRRMQRFQQTQNFYKSLHMLQVNTLLRESDESSPFEDYSIYMYRQQAPVFNDRVKDLERKLLYPDRERGISSALPRGADEQFSDRIKSMEQRITSRNAYGTDKKPKDLLRAIGKIDSSDWNVREIEKKIEQSKKTETGSKGREKVPKWSKEQFVARQSKMSKPTRQDSGEEKFKEIDQTLKNLDKQLKEGSVLEVGERGKNKVASIAGQFVKKDDTSEEKNPPPIAKSNSKVALAFKKQAASEKCHFCKQTVYLMEKISTEGLILHRSCLKCHHCHTNLRLGGYAFDRDDPEGRFYCTQHFKLPAKAIRPVVRKPGQRKSTAHGSHAPDPKTAEKPRGIAENVVQLDLLDRGQTPERIEFENTDAMSDGEPSEEHIIDENEWSGRNFLQPSADSESDLSSSSDESDDDSESDIFEEANGSPIAQQTLQLATDWIGKQHYSNVNSDDSDDDFYDSSEGLIDDGKDDTEGEEIKKAREMRREEVRLLPLPTNLPTDTETEKQSQVVGPPQDGVTSQKIDDVSSERLNRDADKISLTSHASNQTPPPSKADIEKIEQNSDRRFSADVDAISEKLYRLNNLMKMNKDIENMAKENLVKSDILKKLSLKEKWLLDNSVGSVMVAPNAAIHGEKAAETKVEGKLETPLENIKAIEKPTETVKEISGDKPVTNGDDDRGDGLQLNSIQPLNSEEQPTTTVQAENQMDNAQKLTSDKMEIEGILDIVKMMDTSYVEPSKEPLPQPAPSPKSQAKDVGKMLYEAEHKNDNRVSDALRQIEVKNFAGTMDTIKSQMVTPTISHQGSLDISKYFPNAKQEKQSSAALNKTQKTLKDVDLTKYFPQSPIAQRKTSVTTVADRLKKSQTEKAVAPVAEPPKAPPRRQKSMTSSTDKTFSIHEHLLDGAIDIQRAPVVKPVAKKGGIKIVKKIVPKGTKAKKAPVASKKPQDEADKILDEILRSGQEVRSPSVEYQKLFTEEKSPSEDISERIERILEETGIDLGLPPNPKKKLLKTKSLGEDEFKRTQEKMLSKEDGDRPTGVRKILQRFESMSSVKSDDSFRLKKTSLSSTCGSLNKSRDSLHSKESLKSNSDSLSDLEKTMEYLKSEWRTEATNFLQKKRDSFYAHRDEKQAETEAEAKKPIQTEPQWKHTKYSKFFGIKEKSPEKRKSPTKSSVKRKSPAKVLKKSPREEIIKHRKKVESVSSRRASFEEKIKAEEARLKAEELLKASSSKKTPMESQNKLENGLKMDSIDNQTQKSQEATTNGLSKIPVTQSRKDTQVPVELNRNLLDTAQKVLSRRGSGTSGLADILKPPVVKGVRGSQGDKSKTDSGADDSVVSSRRGSQTEDALKAVLNLARKETQTNLNYRNLQSKEGSLKSTPNQSQRGSQAEDTQKSPVNQSKIPSRRGSQTETSGGVRQVSQSETLEKLSSRRGSQAELGNIMSASETPQKPSTRSGTKSPQIQSRRGSQTAEEGVKSSQSQASSAEKQSTLQSREGTQEKATDNGTITVQIESAGISENIDEGVKTSRSQALVTEKLSNTLSREVTQTEATDEVVKTSQSQASVIENPLSREVTQTEATDSLATDEGVKINQSQASLEAQSTFSSQIGSRTETAVIGVKTPLIQSREESQNKAADTRRKESQAETPENGAKSPQIQSRRSSETETTKTPPQSISRKGSTALDVAPVTSRRSPDLSEALDQTITIDDITDVDEIFNEIVNELDNDEEAPEHVRVLIGPTVTQEIELLAVATDMTEEEGEQTESHQIGEEFEKIAKRSRSPSARKSSRASSEDSIEQLFSQFTDDMLVDVEFDSNDEVVAITPRATIVNEDDEEEEERPITIEEAKLKFEPLFPRQVKNFPKSASSSTSISPGRGASKARKIVKKLDPSDMAPSVQDMLQKIIPREDSEPNERLPVAFPRNFYGSEEELSMSSRSRTQTPDTLVKTEERPTKGNHLEVVYELAWPARKRAPSPVPESARPPVKPIVMRGSSELPSSRGGSNNSVESRHENAETPKRLESIPRKGSIKEVESVSTQIQEHPTLNGFNITDPSLAIEVTTSSSTSREDANIQRSSPALLPTPRRGSRTSTDSAEVAISSRRGSKVSLKDDDFESSQRGSPALLPTPRRGSRTSIEMESSLENPTLTTPKQSSPQKDSTPDTSRKESPALLSTPREPSNKVESPPKSIEQSSSQKDTSREGFNTQKESPLLPSTPRQGSKDSPLKSTELANIEKPPSQSIATPDTSRLLPSIPRQGSKESPLKTTELINAEQPPSRSDSTSDTSGEVVDNRRESPTILRTSKRGSKESPLTSPELTTIQQSSFTSDTSKQNFSISTPKAGSTTPNKAKRSPEPIMTEHSSPRKVSSDTSREGSKESPAMLPTPRRGSKTSNEVELQTQTPSRRGSKTSPPKHNQILDINFSPKSGSPLLNPHSLMSKSPSPVVESKPDSPLSARDRFLSQSQSKERYVDRDMSKIPNSVKNSKDLSDHESSQEYKNLLRSKLESPHSDRRPRNPSQSKERSLEWDMEQLPRSPMPRRKYVDMLLQANEKEESPQPVNNRLPSQSPSRTALDLSSKSPSRTAPDIPIPGKRLEEWEIIEQLEKERRLALIKRDENYSHQVQETSLNNTQPKGVSWQPVPTINRLESLEEPRSSKLIEYIKQQTLADSSKQKDGSSKPPSRPRTPPSKTSNDDLGKQAEAQLKSQESDSPKSMQRRQLQKTESTEATYEDFARFTRKSVERDAETEEPDFYESPTSSISHHRLSNYRQKSQDSATGTYSPTNSLSKSIEHLAPSRPHRHKPTTTSSVPENKVDRETKYLMDRSKHLRNMKRDFMEEKIAGNNPYLKKVIEAQKISRDTNDDDDDEVDYALESYRPKNHTTPRFPTSSAIAGRRRREPRYSNYSSTTDYSRRPYSPHFSTASASSSVGSRNFVDYFKRSPPHYKGRESGKDSCVLS